MSYRIQFDINEDQLSRMLPFILKEKNRHVFAEKALNEWINRQEGRVRRSKIALMKARGDQGEVYENSRV